MHGALWVAMKTRGAMEERAREIAHLAFMAVVVMTVALLVIIPLTLPHFGHRYAESPWGLIFPLAALGALVGVRMFNQGKRNAAAFAASCVYILSMLAAAAFGHYPFLLPTIADAPGALTIYNASASSYGLGIGLVWFVPGLALVAAYFAFAYRDVTSKVEVRSERG